MSNYCPKNGVVCELANRYGGCTTTACTKIGEILSRNHVHSQSVLDSATTAKIITSNDVREVVFQLKCIKEHLKFVSRTIDKSVDFDIQVLDCCISRLGDIDLK